MKILQKITEELIPLSTRQNIGLLLVIVCVFQFALFYAPALADEAVEQSQPQEVEEIVSLDVVKKDDIDPEAAKMLPQEMVVSTVVSEEKGEVIVRTSTHVITAYNSEPGQTDDSPCITANNFNVCQHGEEDTIAANFLKFGTKVKIPELFGDRVFIVRDRMNRRHADRVDVWMKERVDAVNFGIKVAQIQVVE